MITHRLQCFAYQVLYEQLHVCRSVSDKHGGFGSWNSLDRKDRLT